MRAARLKPTTRLLPFCTSLPSLPTPPPRRHTQLANTHTATMGLGDVIAAGVREVPRLIRNGPLVRVCVGACGRHSPRCLADGAARCVRQAHDAHRTEPRTAPPLLSPQRLTAPQMLSLGIPLGLGQVVGLATLPAVFNWCARAAGGATAAAGSHVRACPCRCVRVTPMLLLPQPPQQPRALQRTHHHTRSLPRPRRQPPRPQPRCRTYADTSGTCPS
jgi:hypothetical protein